MNILLVCEYWYGTGGWTYKPALEALGCTVHVFDYRKRAEREHALPMPGPLRRRLDRRSMSAELLRTVGELRPDVVLLLKGETIRVDALREIKQRYKPVLLQSGIPTARSTWRTATPRATALPAYRCSTFTTSTLAR